jgi:aspartate/methionine/tyrosine aminotransferase
LANLLEARVITIPPAPSFEPDPAQVEAVITDKTKLIMINSPNNPSGAVYSEKTLRAIAEIAERNNILLVSDEIYEHFVLDGKHFSVGSIYPNTITMNGFSKGYAMTGWRCGYIRGPQEVIDAINELAQYIVFSNSSITQHAALEALRHEHDDLAAKYRKKRDFVVDSLRDMGYEVRGARGAYYVFVKAPHDLTDIEFIDRATERGLILVPGRAFSQLHSYFRISYGTDMQTLERGMAILRELTQDTPV